MKRIILAGLLMLGALSIDAMARDIRTERVTFEKGATSATIASNINGYETVDYVLRARKGQYMKASVATQHGATYFSRTYPLSGIPEALRYFGKRLYRIKIAISVSLEQAA